MAIGNTNNNFNNLSLLSILEKDKLTGPNFLDWERNLRIVLRHERKWYVLEEPQGEAPPPGATTTIRNAYQKHSNDLIDVGCLMLATMSSELQTGLMDTGAYDMFRQLRDMFQSQARTERYNTTKALSSCKMARGTPVSTHVLKIKGHLDHLERLGHPMPLQLATDMILNSLSDDYRQFVVNFNMNNMNKTIPELHSMLKTTELNMGNDKAKPVLAIEGGGVKRKWTSKKSKGNNRLKAKGKSFKAKQAKSAKASTARAANRCFYCNEVGHFKNNCPKRKNETGSSVPEGTK